MELTDQSNAAKAARVLVRTYGSFIGITVPPIVRDSATFKKVKDKENAAKSQRRRDAKRMRDDKEQQNTGSPLKKRHKADTDQINDDLDEHEEKAQIEPKESATTPQPNRDSQPDGVKKFIWREALRVELIKEAVNVDIMRVDGRWRAHKFENAIHNALVESNARFAMVDGAKLSKEFYRLKKDMIRRIKRKEFASMGDADGDDDAGDDDCVDDAVDLRSLLKDSEWRMFNYVTELNLTEQAVGSNDKMS